MIIIVSENNKGAEMVKPSEIIQEEFIQKYIYEHPEIIPLYEIKEDKKLLILKREFNTGSGEIDAVGIDKDGEIYLVETKLYKNDDKRKVVAQVLDYGASLWHVDFSDFITIMESEVQKMYHVDLNQRVRDYFGIGDDEIIQLNENLKRRFSEGDFKFVVLMDKLYSKLLNLIKYINQNSSFSIFPVEMKYYKYKGYEIVIPKLYGTEIKKVFDTKSQLRREWDEQSFFEDAAKLGVEQLQAVNKVYEFSKKTARIEWGTGTQNGSFKSYFQKINETKTPYSVYSNGDLDMSLLWLGESAHATKFRNELRDKMARLGIVIPTDREHFRIPIEKWSPVVNDFINTMKDLTL